MHKRRYVNPFFLFLVKLLADVCRSTMNGGRMGVMVNSMAYRLD